MLRWRNTSNLLSCDFCSDQVSAPHKSRFIGMALKRRYLQYTSRGITPYLFQGTHGGICRSNSCRDVVVILQVVGDEQAQVSECLREAYKAVGSHKGLCLIKSVIHFVFAFCLSRVVLFVIVGGVDLVLLIRIVHC